MVGLGGVKHFVLWINFWSKKQHSLDQNVPKATEMFLGSGSSKTREIFLESKSSKNNRIIPWIRMVQKKTTEIFLASECSKSN